MGESTTGRFDFNKGNPFRKDDAQHSRLGSAFDTVAASGAAERDQRQRDADLRRENEKHARDQMRRNLGISDTPAVNSRSGEQLVLEKDMFELTSAQSAVEAARQKLEANPNDKAAQTHLKRVLNMARTRMSEGQMAMQRNPDSASQLESALRDLDATAAQAEKYGYQVESTQRVETQLEMSQGDRLKGYNDELEKRIEAGQLDAGERERARQYFQDVDTRTKREVEKARLKAEEEIIYEVVNQQPGVRTVDASRVAEFVINTSPRFLATPTGMSEVNNTAAVLKLIEEQKAELKQAAMRASQSMKI